VVFAGTYEHSVDSKNRVAVPAEIRSQIRRRAAVAEGEPVVFYVTLGEDRQALCLYTEQDFERLAAALDESERDPSEILPYENVYFSLAHRVEMDSAGRIRLPETLLKMTSLGSEIVLLGVKDHLELRDRATWQAHVQRVLSERPEILMNPRRALRRNAPTPSNPPQHE
jgi:MraZ protein